jgi:hypothetical protein
LESARATSEVGSILFLKSIYFIEKVYTFAKKYTSEIRQILDVSLEGVSPSDDAFVLSSDYESPISPPSQENNETPDMLRDSWRGMYDEATKKLAWPRT